MCVPPGARTPIGASRNLSKLYLINIGIPIFMLLRSPCQKLKPYNNPFWGFEQRYQDNKITTRRLITKNSGLPKLLRWSHALRSDQAPGSAHARPSARPPIDTSGNFSAHMSGGGIKLSERFSDQLSRQIREF